MILENCKGIKDFGEHLFLSSANGECFYCNLTENEFLASKIGDAKIVSESN